MCPIFVIALLPFVYSAIPLTPHQSDSTSPFILHAFEPGSPIHLSSLNANEGHFWLGKATSSSCRAESKRDCPTGTETVLVVSGGGHAGLDTDVPAGQDIYVAKDGALSFTAAHEEDVTSIAYPRGFSYVNSTYGHAFGSFRFTGTPSKGWLACSVAKNGPWQVYAEIKRTNNTGCLEFEAKGETYDGARVWQYV
ncbi:MAG: hypothetical protein Q9175_005171 [Cornicularia normoerica]